MKRGAGVYHGASADDGNAGRSGKGRVSTIVVVEDAKREGESPNESFDNEAGSEEEISVLPMVHRRKGELLSIGLCLCCSSIVDLGGQLLLAVMKPDHSDRLEFYGRP